MFDADEFDPSELSVHEDPYPYFRELRVGRAGRADGQQHGQPPDIVSGQRGDVGSYPDLTHLATALAGS